jgi:hypothetical protein
MSRDTDQSLEQDKEHEDEMEEWKFRRTRSILAILKHDFTQAAIEYHASLTTHPDFASWKRQALDGGIDEALRLYATRMKKYPSDVPALRILQSNLLALRGNYRQAFTAPTQALDDTHRCLESELFPSSHEYLLQSIREHKNWFCNPLVLRGSDRD